jgi:hypothetical protein
MTTRFPFRFCIFLLLLGLPLACPILSLYRVKPVYLLNSLVPDGLIQPNTRNFLRHQAWWL